ncbi:S ribonuclease [Pyrus ussuriensis x Pyrus communis]|uniref:S ribonuclease n=1 Tax=Pyrus ussuriensis x Pyrus communis TaxID=2448454 RepID=A0A5N5I619_9ROSA|nr:S ribonuclease [Pyrus ussuriensis x Pyrus communis]
MIEMEEEWCLDYKGMGAHGKEEWMCLWCVVYEMRCVMEWGCKGFYRRNEGVYGCLFKHACGWNVVEKQLGKLVESWKACEGHGKASLVLKWVLFCMPRDV